MAAKISDFIPAWLVHGSLIVPSKSCSLWKWFINGANGELQSDQWLSGLECVGFGVGLCCG